MIQMKTCKMLAVLVVVAFNALSQSVSDRIRLNQIGFYAQSQKVAVVVDTSKQPNFYLITDDVKNDTVYQGEMSAANVWEYSEETVRLADFSTFKEKGIYRLFVPSVGISFPFQIGKEVYADVAKATIKAFYFDRASIALEPQYAGKWARKMGHPDREVIVHNSAASAGRKTGTVIQSPKGWYDAGDYNKYIVNSGITMYTLLSLMEDFPLHCEGVRLNIPESLNKVPDILDEILWNLRWMLTMQDPSDGGVYHKLTNSGFDASIMPEFAVKPRYVVKKTTSATLDFAAVMAQASRVAGRYRKQLPGLADSCLKASKQAYAWAYKNPQMAYVQSEMSDPGIMTGAYSDFNFKDEFFWASVELFVTTGKLEYFDKLDLAYYLEATLMLPVWQNIGSLGLYTLARHRNDFKEDPRYEEVNLQPVVKKLLKYGQKFRQYKSESAYGVVMGVDPSDYGWGSNSVCANQGFLLMQVFLLTGDKTYLEAANANLDYILGRNATGYSFLTGLGPKSTRNPHQRLSEADGVEDSLPGFIVGGPNPRQEDKGLCGGQPYPSSLPALSYIDHKCSYASNEIAINWQAAIAYLANAVEAARMGNYEEPSE
jgi:endoglucanase